MFKKPVVLFGYGYAWTNKSGYTSKLMNHQIVHPFNHKRLLFPSYWEVNKNIALANFFYNLYFKYIDAIAKFLKRGK